MIRVIIADDHHLVRQGIRALLERANDIEVVGEAADGREAIELVERLTPDVLVLDIAMPRLGGIQATERIRTLGLATQVVILSMYSDPTLVKRALREGAKGYLLKRSVTEELLLAVRAASRGEAFLSPEVSASIVEGFLTLYESAGEPKLFDRLTPREREILQLIVEGHTNSAIAQMLKVSVKTVEKHRASLMSKLDAHNVADLVRAAIKGGLIFLGLELG